MYPFTQSLGQSRLFAGIWPGRVIGIIDLFKDRECLRDYNIHNAGNSLAEHGKDKRRPKIPCHQERSQWWDEEIGDKISAESVKKDSSS